MNDLLGIAWRVLLGIQVAGMAVSAWTVLRALYWPKHRTPKTLAEQAEGRKLIADRPVWSVLGMTVVVVAWAPVTLWITYQDLQTMRRKRGNA